MLTIRITNDGEGTNESANYRYFVFINQKEIERGEIQGHNRKDGWAALVKSIANRHLTPRAPDRAARCPNCKSKWDKFFCAECGYCKPPRQ